MNIIEVGEFAKIVRQIGNSRNNIAQTLNQCSNVIMRAIRKCFYESLNAGLER